MRPITRLRYPLRPLEEKKPVCVAVGRRAMVYGVGARKRVLEGIL